MPCGGLGCGAHIGVHRIFCRTVPRIQTTMIRYFGVCNAGLADGRCQGCGAGSHLARGGSAVAVVGQAEGRAEGSATPAGARLGCRDARML